MFFSKNNKFNFKITVFSLVLISTVIFLLPQISRAQVLVPQIDGLTTASLETVAVSLIQVFLGLLGLIALVIILYAGFVWMTSGGNEEKISQAKKILSAGVIGLVIILTSYIIASFILEGLQESVGSGNGSSSNRDNFGGGLGGGALGGGILEYHYPERDATNIPRNTMIMMTFKTEISDEGVIGDSFTDSTCDSYIDSGNQCGKLGSKIDLIDDGENRDKDFIMAVITPDAKKILIKPLEPLGSDEENTITAIHLSADMESAEGQLLFPGLDNGYRWQFEVSTFLDLTPPEVSFVWPEQNQTVARNAIIQINFSEPINILDVSNVNIAISANASSLNGDLVISNEYKTVEFLTDGDCGGVNVNSCNEEVFCLPANSDIESIVDNISDASGNIMEDSYDWVFSTNNTIDLDPPIITDINPNAANGLVNIRVNPNPPISATFDKVISPGSVNTDNLYIYNNTLCSSEDYEDEEGKSRIDNYCFPSYSVYTDSNSQRCNIKLYAPYLDQSSSYRPRLNAKIKDSYGNCFYESIGPGGTGQQIN